MISRDDLVRFHAAARMVEDDLDEAYFSCRRAYGADVAGALLVAALRRALNVNPDQWPPPEDLRERVNDRLREIGLLGD